VVGNIVNDMDEYGIYVDNSCSDIIVSDNQLIGATLGGMNESTAVSYGKNIGFDTATSSTATITSGNTYVAVTHGLDITPATSTINIIPTNNLGDASSTIYWVSKVATTTFRINVGIDPGASGADFSWNVGSY